MKPMTTARRALLASILAGTTLVSTGCSSGGFPLASMNPFSKPTPTAAASDTNSTAGKRFTKSLAATTSTVGQTAKTALTKTTSAVAAVFTRDRAPDDIDNTDPLSLSNKPKKVSPEVFVANGQLWESTGDHTKAMESYIKALESDPEHVPALTSIARLHFRDGKFEQAAEFFQRAIELSPEDAGLHNDLGLTLSKLNDHAGSIRSLEKALQLAPGTSRYANNLASLKFAAGDIDRAFQVLHENNKPAVAHFNMAYLHFKNGQTTQAKQHLTEVLRTNPSETTDPAIKRAIERSRDMLVQIDGPNAVESIAQTTPQATIAGGKFLEAKQKSTTPSVAVQQISQSSQRVAVTPSLPKATRPTPTPSATLPSAVSASRSQQLPSPTSSITSQLPTQVSGVPTQLPTKVTGVPTQLPTKVTGVPTQLPTKVTRVPTQLPTAIAPNSQLPTVASATSHEPTTASSAVTPPPASEVAASKPATTSISDVKSPAPATAVSAISLPPPSESSVTNPPVDRPSPIKPSETEADEDKPSFPFSLPASFKAPEAN